MCIILQVRFNFSKKGPKVLILIHLRCFITSKNSCVKFLARGSGLLLIILRLSIQLLGQNSDIKWKGFGIGSVQKDLPEFSHYEINSMLDYDHNIERHFFSSRTLSQEVSLSQKISMKRRGIRIGLRFIQNPLRKDFRIQALRTLRTLRTLWTGQATVVCKICSSSCEKVTKEPIFFVVTWAETR